MKRREGNGMKGKERDKKSREGNKEKGIEVKRMEWNERKRKREEK